MSEAQTKESKHRRDLFRMRAVCACVYSITTKSHQNVSTNKRIYVCSRALLSQSHLEEDDVHQLRIVKPSLFAVNRNRILQMTAIYI